MSTEIEDKNLKEFAWKICKDFLGGQWKAISQEELRLFKVSGGLLNALYRCCLPENALKSPPEPRDVLLRIYGPMQSNIELMLTEAVAFMLLSERHIGPKLYGLFPKGRLEEFIPSRSLTNDDLRLFCPLIAREMAKIHSLDVPVKKVPNLFPDEAKKWLDEAKEIILNESTENRFMSFEECTKEIEWITNEMEKTQSPIRFCHNDLRGGNILCREDSSLNDKPSLMLIDFEMGGYNYSGFDFGNYFFEWCVEYETDEYPHFKLDLNKFPSEQEQREFFIAYLDQMSKEGFPLSRPLEEELERMIHEVPLFVSAAQLLWALCCLKVSLDSTGNFSFVEHGKLRGKLYYVYKEQYLAGTSSKKNV